MENSKDNSKNLDISYQKVEDKLKKDLSVLSYGTDQDTIEEIIDSFMKNHLIKSSYVHKHSTTKHFKKNLEKMVFHCAFKSAYFNPTRYYKFYDRRGQWSEDVNRSDLDRIYSNDLEYFIYPHSELNNFFCRANMQSHNYLKILKRISPEPLSKVLMERWDKALFLYKKLEELKDDDEKCIKCLQEWGDEEFVIHSIEYKIGQNLHNKNLWKLYIAYWSFKDPKIMVGVYSRYCSFFLDDVEMKEEYKKEAEKYGIDVDDEMPLLDYKKFGSFTTPTLPSLTKSVIPKCNFDEYFRQSLPFHNSFINYLMDYSKPEVLQKLLKCCKYFFKKRPTPICHRLVIAKDQRFDDPYRPNYYFKQPQNPDPFIFDRQALTIADDHVTLNDLNNLYLTNCLHIAESFDSGLFKKMLQKVYRSDIKYLTIENHVIELKDYIFLTKSGTVKTLAFHKSEIVYPDGSLAALEDIMETLPNANIIDLRNFKTNVEIEPSSVVRVNAESFKKLAAMPRNTKLYFFGLGGCDIEAFNANDFFEFTKKNIIIEDRDSQFAVHFDHHENGVDILKTIVKTINDLFTAFDIPRICFTVYLPTNLRFSIFAPNPV